MILLSFSHVEASFVFQSARQAVVSANGSPLHDVLVKIDVYTVHLVNLQSLYVVQKAKYHFLPLPYKTSDTELLYISQRH